MATADDVLAHLQVAFSGVEENQKQVEASSTGADSTVAQLDQVRSTAEELSSQLQVMGIEDKVAVIQAAISKSNEAQTQMNAVKQTLLNARNALNGTTTTLREVEAQIQSLKGLADAPAAAPAGTSGRAAAVSGSLVDQFPDYPWDKPHPISESDLRHVCYGDEGDNESGGHLYGEQRPGKTEFPEGWDEDRIEEVLRMAADRPERVREQLDGRWRVSRHINGVEVVAVVDPDGHIDSGWPRKGPWVNRNPTADDSRSKGPNESRRGKRR